MRAMLVTVTALFVAAITCPLDAQSLADRFENASGDIVRLSFPTRPEICGDGKSIGERTENGFVTQTFWSGGYSVDSQEFWEIDCRTGPMRLVVERRNGRVTELRVAVGVDWLPDARGTDLGTFSGSEAANWLLDVAEANEDVGSIALLAANAAQDAPIANRLFEMARDGALHSEVRERAVRWVNRAAEREGMSERADRVLRELVLASGDNTDVRERAIRSLRKSDENDAWLREQYGNINRTQLRERLIRRLGASYTASNAAWLRSVVLNTRERLELRERALRVVGEQATGLGEIRALYGRLDHSVLKERALRIVGERGSAEDFRWVRQVAENVSERTNVRERAIRILAADADLASMQQLYRDIDASALRERVLRTVGERRTAETAEWLEQVATDSEEPTELRDRALRLLGEYELSAVRGLFESLDSDELRERALRISAERNDASTSEWLRGIATSNRYSVQVRDRALKLLAESPLETLALAAIYDDVTGHDLRRRVIRILAERGDEAAIEKLRSIAEVDPSRELRRYAWRRLGELR